MKVCLLFAFFVEWSATLANASVIYRGLQNIAIPTDFTGVYVNIDTGMTAFAEFTGWDINPFFGGFGTANSPAFQPVRTGTAILDPIVALGIGATVNASLNFSTNYGGSQTHLGPAANQFGIGQEAYMGFRFTTDGGAGPYFGWMRLIFTANTPGGIVKDWAYESGGGAIQTGDVLQAAPVAGVSVVTLSGGAGNSATLGTPLPNAGADNTLRFVKTGAGIWTLPAIPASSSVVATDGTLKFNTSQTLDSLDIGAGAVVELTGAASSPAPPDAFTNPAPEPGSTILLVVGFASLLSRRKHGGKTTARIIC